MKIVGRLKQYVLRVVLLQVTVVGGFNAAHAQAENVEETEVEDSGLTVSNARYRVMPPGQKVTAGYLSIHNNTSNAETLIEVDSAQAQRIELHLSEMDQDGMMSMRHTESVTIESLSTLALKPGAYHLMLFGVQPDIDNASIVVNLVFESGNKLTVMLVAEEL